MKTLQIWIEALPENIAGYMASVVKFTPDAEHFLISDKIKSFPGVQVLGLEEELAKARTLLGDPSWWNEYCSEHMFTADMLRLAWAITTPELLYLDADVELTGPPIIPADCALAMGETCGYQEFFMFYSNGAANWFQALVDYTTKQAPKRMAFMRTFLQIKFGKCLSQPVLMEKSFYIRH